MALLSDDYRKNLKGSANANSAFAALKAFFVSRHFQVR
jgi:hypothetical protein